MRRRELISLLGSVAAWPLAARGQQPDVVRRVGVLIDLAADDPEGQAYVAAFQEGLQKLGWTDGRNLRIDTRWGAGEPDRLRAYAAEMVGLKPDVIAAGTTSALASLQQAARTIPIVFAQVSDPVRGGFVASLARPGGNATGTSSQTADLGSKRLDLVREVVPTLRRLAIMANVGAPNAMLDMREVAAAARTLGVEVVTLEIQRAEDIAPAFDALKSRADALYVCGEPLVNTNRVRINTLALGARLPTMFGLREYVEAGGLMSYGPNQADLYRRAGDYVDKILRGAKPADIPVEQPTKFDLVVNLITAQALGLTIPPMLLARADEVIE